MSRTGTGNSEKPSCVFCARDRGEGSVGPAHTAGPAPQQWPAAVGLFFLADFKKACWDMRAARGCGSSWLRAVQELYANVPLSVRTADDHSPCFQSRVGLKQGCPLSPTRGALLGVSIDDF